MRYTLCLLLMLCGCTTTKLVPVVSTPVKVPPLPTVLDKNPAVLPPIANNDVKTVLKDSLLTSRAYNGLRADYIDLRHFYNCVKTSLNEKTELSECLKK